MIQLGSLVVLLLLAIWDWREKKVPVWLIMLFLVWILPALLEKSSGERILSFLTAGGIAAVCFLWRRKEDCIGKADIWTLCACPLIYSVSVFCGGLLITGVAAAVAAGITYLKTKNKEQKIPFLPFLFLGIAGWYIGEKVIWS